MPSLYLAFVGRTAAGHHDVSTVLEFVADPASLDSRATQRMKNRSVSSYRNIPLLLEQRRNAVVNILYVC